MVARNDPMEAVLQFVATLAAGLFAGAATYVSFVEHPARLQCGTSLAVTEFGPSYKRAAAMQAPLATIGFLSGTAAWLTGASILWAVGGLLLAVTVMVTLIVIFPTNKQLLDPALDKESPLAKRLLVRWGWLHGLRTILSIVAFVMFLILKSR
jgi:uncharacterized membrane protein